MTDPPIIGDLGVVVGAGRRAALVISQDVFPEIATELGRLDNPRRRRSGALVRFYLRRADRSWRSARPMRERLRRRARRRSISGHPELGRHRVRSPPAARQRLGAGARPRPPFVVMHSGNVGHAQDLDASSARRRPARPRRPGGRDRRFGARHTELGPSRHGSSRRDGRFLAYQQRERLPLSLSAADVHVVGLAPVSPVMSSRAASTGSSPPAARSSSRPTRTARLRGSSTRSAVASSFHRHGPTCLQRDT